MLRKFGLIAVLLVMVFSGTLMAQDEGPVEFGIVCELSGHGASHGAHWRDGILLAFSEINNAGGILGRQIEYFLVDTESRPAISIAAMQYAITKEPFAILGTIYSSSTIANMATVEEAGIIQMVGSTSTSIYEQGNYNVFATSPINRNVFPWLVRWMGEDLGVEQIVMVYTNDEMGSDGRDILSAAAEEFGLGFEGIAIQTAQADFAGEIARIQGMGADTIFLYGHEEENARFMIQLKTLGVDLSVVGYSPLLSALAVELGGEAMEGVMGAATWSYKYEPIADFAAMFQLLYDEIPSHDAMKGYVAVYTLKTAIEAVGAFDADAVRTWLHENTITTEMEPNVFLNTSYREDGTVDRNLFLVKIENGEQVIIKIISSQDG
ncbi:ABC transporter substrate-binding protein [Candidatus Bipolaricaulota bacterium]|jgi:branched-chain amino acid transport system substrate-binding protein|nr:ABC transporter substrate-binding protein [Candidatus Bipolaricaulota bacterium]